MKIIGIAVDTTADEYDVLTVRVKLGKQEDFEEADAQRILDLARELAGEADGTAHDENGNPVTERAASRDTVRPPLTDEERNVAADQPQEGRRRRGAGNPTEVAGNSPDTQPSSPTTSGRRRRGVSASSAEPAETNDAEGTAAASTTTSHSEGGRRRRGAADPTSTQSDAPSTDAPRRRSRSLGEAPASEPNSGGAASIKLTDADLSKAASQAALVLGPEGVKSVLSEFGVKKLNELDEKQRQSFFNALKEDLEKAEAEKGDRVEPPARRRRG